MWVANHEPACGHCGAPNPSFSDDSQGEVQRYEFSSSVRPSTVAESVPSSGALINFQLAGIPVSVHWSFLIIALLAAGIYEGVEIAAWTVAVFAAILLHEAGHGLTARKFGARSVAIRLFAFGGATTWDREPAMTPGQRFITTAAGSGVGIVAGALVIAAVAIGDMPASGGLGLVLLESFVWASLVWGGLNWLPILPLDGGQMVRAFLDVIVPRHAHNLTRAVTVVVGVAVIAALVIIEDWFLVFFAGMIILAGVRSPDPTPSASRTERGTQRPGRALTGLWMGLSLLVALGAVAAALVFLASLNVGTAFG